MATTFKVFKETALPGTLQPHSVYFIAPAGETNLLEVYVTNASASAPVRHVLNKTEVQTMIDASIASSNELTIVADIAARNALTPTRAQYVYVINATGDATVASGGATYLYNTSGSTWIKVSEAESLDVTVTWASITGKPTSTPAQIDTAVANSHTHTNKTQIDLIGQNAGGEMTYNGTQVKTEWSSTGW
jgi:hypothetical protein